MSVQITLNNIKTNLVWHFCFAALSRKIEKIQKQSLCVLYNDSYSSYNNLPLKVERPTMEVSHLWRLAIKVFKAVKSLNPDFNAHVFQERFTLCLEKK